jgi:hypothetical protein
VGTTPEQARAQIAATRARAGATLDRIETRLRRELDPKRRLRRDGARIAAGVAVVALVGTVYVLRRRHHREADQEAQDWIEEMPEEWRQRLQELLSEAADRARPGGAAAKPQRSRGLAQSLALRAGRMALPVVMNAVGERLAARQAGGRAR